LNNIGTRKTTARMPISHGNPLGEKKKKKNFTLVHIIQRHRINIATLNNFCICILP
jgi:hypothetical protein